MALKRSGLISDWYDRKIEPGDESDARIREAMERAGIILLLVSADFLISKYIFEVEIPFALKRHESGLAKVIPVLLRPVEWRDLPFAKLQLLPSEARAVTLWPNQDEAFSDIAGRLRELLYSERLRELTAEEVPVRVSATTQERVLDAAIASSVVIDEPTDLVTMVRGTESGGLRAILQIDRTYSPASDDVQSKTFELDFPSDDFGNLLPAKLELALESPGFDPPRQRKKIRIPPARDSDVSVFMLTPKHAGTLRLNLQAISADVEIGSRALVTNSVSAAKAQPILSYGLTSLQLKPSVEKGRQPKNLLEMARSEPPTPSLKIPLKDNRREDGISGSQPMAYPGASAPPREARRAAAWSRRATWIGIGSSAAAIALVCTAVVWNGGNAARSPASNVAKPPQEIAVLSEAIKREPNSADLYLKRAKQYEQAGNMDEALTDANRAVELAPNNARAHLSYAELLEKASLRDQALREYKRVLSLNPTPGVRAIGTQRAAELERQLSAPVN